MQASDDDLLLGHSLLRSFKATRHASSALPNAHDAISIHRLALECFLVVFPTQWTRDAASTTLRTPPSPATAEEADACVEPVSFEAQLPPRPDTSVPSQDQMLIDARVQTPKKITPTLPKHPDHYHDTTQDLPATPRSDAARPSASAALRPSTPPPTPPATCGPGFGSQDGGSLKL
jgi:hypothetical protein